MISGCFAGDRLRTVVYVGQVNTEINIDSIRESSLLLVSSLPMDSQI
jgi:hypothetical protein